ncbi:MAG: hypothetical protein NT062_33495 [Proteobacteria bacterium]|nr:hypothetical protein [Pseudomonadota bacterium]
MMRIALALAGGLVACGSPLLDPDRAGSASAPRSSPLEAQCALDDDCVLLPDALTCCLECPPAPPFEAAPRWMLDGMLIEHETTCAIPKLCPPVRCTPIPVGCVATPVCREGRCAFDSTGCGPAPSTRRSPLTS